jgi:hypothetical protein
MSTIFPEREDKTMNGIRISLNGERTYLMYSRETIRFVGILRMRSGKASPKPMFAVLEFRLPLIFEIHGLTRGAFTGEQPLPGCSSYYPGILAE